MGNNSNFYMKSKTTHQATVDIPSDEDDEDRAFKEIDDLYEYVRSGILPDYLKTTITNETLLNSRSKLNNINNTIATTTNTNSNTNNNNNNGNN